MQVSGYFSADLFRVFGPYRAIPRISRGRIRGGVFHSPLVATVCVRLPDWLYNRISPCPGAPSVMMTP